MRSNTKSTHIVSHSNANLCNASKDVDLISERRSNFPAHH